MKWTTIIVDSKGREWDLAKLIRETGYGYSQERYGIARNAFTRLVEEDD